MTLSEERSCLYASGDILGKEMAKKLNKVKNFEDFLSEILSKGKDLLSFEYEMTGENEAYILIKKSIFWEIVDKTSIYKIKKAGCTSERLFLETALREFFPRAMVLKSGCRAEGDDRCRLKLYLEKID